MVEDLRSMFKNVGPAAPSRFWLRPATGVVDIMLFLTGEIELKQVWEAVVLAVVAGGAGAVAVVVVIDVVVGVGVAVSVAVAVAAAV